ncbi:MAG TPA: hypothetical protein GXX56_08975 [Rhodocyclaceae bacterium]|nr:hypothetical protein [Rhodocyclaceae bacterium]
MTISSEVRKSGPYTGNDVTTSFPFSFKVFSADDVVVVLTDPAGIETTLTGSGTDYSVTLNADQDTAPGGTVEKVSALATDYLLTITSSVPNLQPLDLTNQGGFYPKVINAALDRLTILAQQNAEQIGRSVKVPISSSVTPDSLIAQLTQDAATAAAAASSASASETAAAGSASSAAGSASAAGVSATAAGNSQTAAAASQSAAASSETNAANSATAAANSATTATTQAGNAATSATNAANSATAAAGSATSAASSATTASTQASNAATSATNAANSATAAAGSATLAQQFAESITPTTSLQKADKASPCLVKTGGGTLAVKAGTTVYLSGGVVSFASQTAVTMPALSAGEDYSVWVLPDGTAQAVADPFSTPASAPAPGALKIGGFHYGLVAPGTTVASGGFSTSGFSNTGGSMIWTQADVDHIAGINEFSIWDLRYRSNGEQHGFTLDPQTRTWLGLYICSTNHIANGISRYNTDVASGTVLPRIPLAYGGDGMITYGRLSLYEAVEIAASHNCRLPSYEEFMSAAFGVTEGQSLGGASSTIPATARQAGYTSRIGMEQATGHHWIIGAPFGSSGGSTWSGTGRGSLYGTTGLPLFGGSRSDAAHSGSRCSNWSAVAWNSHWSIGLRAACDHLNL